MRWKDSDTLLDRKTHAELVRKLTSLHYSSTNVNDTETPRSHKHKRTSCWKSFDTRHWYTRAHISYTSVYMLGGMRPPSSWAQLAPSAYRLIRVAAPGLVELLGIADPEVGLHQNGEAGRKWYCNWGTCMGGADANKPTCKSFMKLCILRSNSICVACICESF